MCRSGEAARHASRKSWGGGKEGKTKGRIFEPGGAPYRQKLRSLELAGGEEIAWKGAMQIAEEKRRMSIIGGRKTEGSQKGPVRGSPDAMQWEKKLFVKRLRYDRRPKLDEEGRTPIR